MGMFARDGTLFLIERIKGIAYRQLLRRCHEYQVASMPMDAPENVKYRFKLAYFSAALKACGETSDLDEVECIVANMIAQKRVVGAISHNHRILALSQKNPFPQL